MQSQRCSLYF